MTKNVKEMHIPLHNSFKFHEVSVKNNAARQGNIDRSLSNMASELCVTNVVDGSLNCC